MIFLSFSETGIRSVGEHRAASMTKKKKKNLPIFIPHELIEQILVRLPVRSLLRFKCVCKTWLSLISDPQFAKSHFDLAAAPTHRLLFREKKYSIKSIDTEASLLDDSAAVYLPLPPYLVPLDLHDLSTIIGSCRGLVLLNYGEGDLIVWNPSTGAYKRLRENRYMYMNSYRYGFGYDASTDDYLFILLDVSDEPGRASEVSFYSIKTNSWTSIECNGYMKIGNEFRGGSLLNGALHWLVCGLYDDRAVPVITAFDLAKRTLLDIPLPHHLTGDQAYSLRVLGGCICVCCLVEEGAFEKWAEIWVMKEYNVQASWTKSFVLSGSDLSCFSPICVTEDGGILGSNRRRLEKRSEKGKLLEHLTFSVHQRLHLDNLQSAMYRESLLSFSSVRGETIEDDQ